MNVNKNCENAKTNKQTKTKTKKKQKKQKQNNKTKQKNVDIPLFLGKAHFTLIENVFCHKRSCYRAKAYLNIAIVHFLSQQMWNSPPYLYTFITFH